MMDSMHSIGKENDIYSICGSTWNTLFFFYIQWLTCFIMMVTKPYDNQNKKQNIPNFIIHHLSFPSPELRTINRKFRKKNKLRTELSLSQIFNLHTIHTSPINQMIPNMHIAITVWQLKCQTCDIYHWETFKGENRFMRPRPAAASTFI